MRALKEYYDKYGYRLYITFNSIEDLSTLSEDFPLNKNFIDDVAKFGIEIYYDLNCDTELKGFLSPGLSRIVINSRLDNHQKDITLIHELIHLAFPSIPDFTNYEDAIDKIAMRYVQDKYFIDYIKKTIKIQTS